MEGSLGLIDKLCAGQVPEQVGCEVSLRWLLDPYLRHSFLVGQFCLVCLNAY